MNNENNQAAFVPDAATMARSLLACANPSIMKCRYCHKTFDMGCAEALKTEAAHMLEEMAAKAAERGKA